MIFAEAYNRKDFTASFEIEGLGDARRASCYERDRRCDRQGELRPAERNDTGLNRYNNAFTAKS